MKYAIILLLCFHFMTSFSQQLQFHYDARHSIDPKYNPKNFTTLYFEYFKDQDSGKAFFKPGSFLLKMQADFLGQDNNMGKFYMQVSQSFRCWQPKIFLDVQYSGGLGVTEPKQYSFYINNTFSLGLSYPFKWKGAFIASQLNFKFVPYKKPSSDFLYTLYWWRGLMNYKFEFAGDFSVWTENKNHGDDFTKNLQGKRFSFFAEPQFWYNASKDFSVGTKTNMYYHINTTDNVFQAYPTIAVRCKL
ncbi:MAG: DUF5020 family protein [Bacteroidetes bacterium]|jgi:hypothetical protein|nr:DUF5020 family protein [Bacteroidota bacterium]